MSKTKGPKTPPYSDIDLTRWREYDHVWTDSLWLIKVHPCTIQVRLILRY